MILGFDNPGMVSNDVDRESEWLLRKTEVKSEYLALFTGGLTCSDRSDPFCLS